MFTLFRIIYWFTAHYLCDFLLQNDNDAQNKSHSIEALLNHTSIYSIAMGVLYYFAESSRIDQVIIFISIMFLSHTVIDFISSRIESYFYRKDKRGAFFNVLGLDQLLHYIIIFLTLKYL